MAVSASQSTLLTIDEYLLDGYKKAGLVPIEADIGFDSNWNAKAAHGRRTLNRLIEGLANEGFLDHFVELSVVQLAADDGLYSLDAEVLNVVDNASYIPLSNGIETEEVTGETPVTPMSRHMWQQLSSKASTGTPTKYFLDRNSTNPLVIHLWPIPTEAGSLRIKTHRIPSSHSLGSDNVDLKRHWGSWLVHALAYEFMSDAKLPLDERAIIREDRDQIMAKIKTYETSNEPPDVIFSHCTPWSW